MALIRSLWSRHKLLIKIGLAIGILAILATRMDWNAVSELVANIKPQFFIAALLLMAGQVLMLALRWENFMNAEEKLVGYKDALNMSVASQLANFVFITSVGGVLLRLFLARHYGLSILKSICAVIGDRVMTVIAIFIFAILFIPVLTKLIPADLMDEFILLLEIAVPVGIAGAFFGLQIAKPYILKNKSIHASFIYMKELVRKPNRAAPILLSSLCGQGCFFLAGCMAAKAIDVQFDFLSFLAVLPFISLISSLPIGFGGWGIREGAFIVALKFLNIPMESAFLISVQIGVLSILATLLTAVPLIFTGDLIRIFKLRGASNNKILDSTE